MAYELNGRAVIGGTVYEPSVGVWHAELEVDTLADITGAVTLALDGVTCAGVVSRGGIDGGRWLGRLTGGAGKLSTPLAPKSYISCPLALPLGDVLTEAGESADPSSRSLEAAVVPAWVRSRGLASHALSQIADFTGDIWRITRAGAVFFGAQAFPAQAVAYTLIQDDSANSSLTIAPDASALVEPAAMLDGFAVSYVATSISSSSVRQHVYYL